MGRAPIAASKTPVQRKRFLARRVTLILPALDVDDGDSRAATVAGESFARPHRNCSAPGRTSRRKRELKTWEGRSVTIGLNALFGKTGRVDSVLPAGWAKNTGGSDLPGYADRAGTCFVFRVACFVEDATAGSAYAGTRVRP
jgi:hypothetical protein